jgi:type II secretory pathway component GspD/PulD (secretin)
MKKNNFRVKEVLFVFLLIFTAATIASAYQTPAERADAYYKQGYLYYLEKDYWAAVAEYDKAIALNSGMAKAYYWRGKTYYALKDYAKAKESIVKAINLSPHIDDGPALLKKVETAQKNQPVIISKPEPKPQPSEALTEKGQPIPKQEKELLLSMELKAVEIAQAFQLLARETGQNIVVSKDVHGKISLSLNNVKPEEAFDAILKAGKCKAIKEGTILRIVPTGEPKRIQILPGGLINKTYQIDYIDSEDAAATLSSLLPDGTKVITTPGSNYLIVEGFQDAIDKADAIIANLDTPPEQVMVEAKILELSHNVTSGLGMNLKYTNPNNPSDVVQTKGFAAQPTSTTASGLYYSVTSQNIDALLETLQTKTGYNLLSTPKVMAINGREAEIITGQMLGYKVKTITETGMVESVEFLDVGTKLVFTPSIKTNGLIMMDIHPEISEGSIVNDLPQKKSTETTTQLLVKNGDTIVIGGLMKDVTQKVNRGIPFLSEIPFIGVPFRRVELITEKREIVVLISPHIVDTDLLEDLEKESDELEKRRQDEHYESPMDLIM